MRDLYGMTQNILGTSDSEFSLYGLMVILIKPDFQAINKGLLFHYRIRRWRDIKHKSILKTPLEHISIN